MWVKDILHHKITLPLVKVKVLRVRSEDEHNVSNFNDNGIFFFLHPADESELPLTCVDYTNLDQGHY